MTVTRELTNICSTSSAGLVGKYSRIEQSGSVSMASISVLTNSNSDQKSRSFLVQTV